MKILANIITNINSIPDFPNSDGSNILKMLFDCRLGIVLRTNLDSTNMNIVLPTIRCLAALFKDKATAFAYEVRLFELCSHNFQAASLSDREYELYPLSK